MGTTHLSGLDVGGVPTMGTAAGLPIAPTPAKYFWVCSVNGSNGNTGRDAGSPLATVAYALDNLVTASRGDTIVVMQGHAEDIIAAGTWTCDVAGVNIIGLGTGTDRPEITFKTATTASCLITAANVQIANIVCIAGVDLLANPFHVQAAGCTLGNFQNGPIEWQDAGATQAIRQVLTTTAGNDLRVNMKVAGSTTGGTAPVNCIRMVGTDGAIINLDFYGRASTAVVEMITTACTNVEVYGYIYNSGTTTGLKNVVDTQGSSTWFANINDGAAGVAQAGGSARALSSLSAGGWNLAVKTISDASVLTTGASPVTFFTVTGDVMVKVWGTVQTLIVSTSNTGTLAVGVTGALTALLGTTTASAGGFGAGMVWVDTTPDETKAFAGANASGAPIAGGADIICTIATNSMTSGALTMYCLWQPISAGSSVVAA